MWNENNVREWSEVAAKVRISSTPAHMGRIFAILVEKDSEFEPDNPLRKYKGRVVLQGNNV
eukprot:9025224-Prorocentrum_lima.AAC.1